MLYWPFYSIAPAHWLHRNGFRYNWATLAYGNGPFQTNLVSVPFRANCNRLGKSRGITDELSAAIQPSAAVDQSIISESLIN